MTLDQLPNVLVFLTKHLFNSIQLSTIQGWITEDMSMLLLDDELDEGANESVYTKMYYVM